MKLEARTALVTGGAVRIGRAICRGLAAAGCRVGVHYGSSRSSAEELVEELRAGGTEAMALGGDLRSDEVCAGLVERAERGLGPVDVLVNNAGIFPGGGLLDTSLDTWEEVFAVNLRAPWLVSRSFAQRIAPERPGRIVNVTDARSNRAEADHPAYRITKVGLGELTRLLALELAPSVTVNAVAPGSVLEATGDPPGSLEARVRNRVPLRRAGGTRPVVDAVLYLLRSDFVTGEEIRIDGGEYV